MSIAARLMNIRPAPDYSRFGVGMARGFFVGDTLKRAPRFRC
jgi:hypothetical protein